MSCPKCDNAGIYVVEDPCGAQGIKYCTCPCGDIDGPYDRALAFQRAKLAAEINISRLPRSLGVSYWKMAIEECNRQLAEVN